MSEPAFTLAVDDDLPRTLRREREAREQQAREQIVVSMPYRPTSAAALPSPPRPRPSRTSMCHSRDWWGSFSRLPGRYSRAVPPDKLALVVGPGPADLLSAALEAQGLDLRVTVTLAPRLNVPSRYCENAARGPAMAAEATSPMQRVYPLTSPLASGISFAPRAR